MLSVYGSAGIFSPLVIGLILMILIFAGVGISGAHYNPAVTLSLWYQGSFPFRDVPAYIMAQVSGAVASVFVSLFILKLIPHSRPINSMDIMDFVPASSAEFIGTFLVCIVYLIFSLPIVGKNRSFLGFAAGMTLALCIYLLNKISGAAFNPAVAVGYCIAEKSPWANLTVYISGHVIAALASGSIYNLAVAIFKRHKKKKL